MDLGMKRWLVLAMVAPLAACNPFASNDGPSEKDIADALVRSGAKVQSTERIACKTAPDRPGYVCDYRATTCSPFTGKCDKSATRTGRFVRYGDNWMFRDDVIDPNRYAPTPAPSPVARIFRSVCPDVDIDTKPSIRIAAALVTSRPVRPSPVTTADLALPVASYASRTRVRMNTS